MAKKNKRFSLAERKAYWIGYGMGLQNPSGKSGSYVSSLSENRKKSFKNGYDKSYKIPVTDMQYFQNKKRK